MNEDDRAEAEKEIAGGVLHDGEATPVRGGAKRNLGRGAAVAGGRFRVAIGALRRKSSGP